MNKSYFSFSVLSISKPNLKKIKRLKNSLLKATKEKDQAKQESILAEIEKLENSKQINLQCEGIRFKFRDVLEQHIKQSIEYRTDLKEGDLPAILYVCSCCVGVT